MVDYIVLILQLVLQNSIEKNVLYFMLFSSDTHLLIANPLRKGQKGISLELSVTCYFIKARIILV
jgi:hypothetical protein